MGKKNTHLSDILIFICIIQPIFGKYTMELFMLMISFIILIRIPNLKSIDKQIIILSIIIIYVISSGILIGGTPISYIMDIKNYKGTNTRTFIDSESQVIQALLIPIAILIIPRSKTEVMSMVNAMRLYIAIFLIEWVLFLLFGFGKSDNGNFIGTSKSHVMFTGPLLYVLSFMITYSIYRGNYFESLIYLISMLPGVYIGSDALYPSILIPLATTLVLYKKRMLLIPLILFSLLYLIHNNNIQNTLKTFSYRNLELLSRFYKEYNWSPGEKLPTKQEIPVIRESDRNTIIRSILYKHAIDLFLRSPLVGVGFGRFNDRSLRFWGIDGLFYPAIDGIPTYKVSGNIREIESNFMHSHNLYLQIISELGILGIIIFFIAIYRMYRIPLKAGFYPATSVLLCFLIYSMVETTLFNILTCSTFYTISVVLYRNAESIQLINSHRTFCARSYQ